MELVHFPNEGRVVLHAVRTHLFLVGLPGDGGVTRSKRLHTADTGQLDRVRHLYRLLVVSKMNLLTADITLSLFYVGLPMLLATVSPPPGLLSGHLPCRYVDRGFLKDFLCRWVAQTVAHEVRHSDGGLRRAKDVLLSSEAGRRHRERGHWLGGR